VDEEDDLERRITGAARRRKRVLIALGVVVVGIGCTPCVIVAWRMGDEVAESAARREEHSQRATAEQIAEVDRALEAAVAGLPARTVAWREAMTDARAMVPAPELGDCPVRLPMRQPMSAQRGGSFNNLDSFDAIVFAGGQGFPHAVVHGEPLPEEPPRVTYARERVEELRRLIRGTGSHDDHAAWVTAAAELSGDAFWTYDVLFFPTEWRRPYADALGTTFTPGAASGPAVLYDYRQRSLACAGHVAATTTSQVVDYQAHLLEGGRTLQQMLDYEFDAELERAMAAALRSRARRHEDLPEAAELSE
jgi:hypothetical protein